MFLKFMTARDKTVLITGGAGFIGTHTAEVLLANGYRVRVLDNLAPPTHDGSLPPWFQKDAEFFKGDVRSKEDWLVALKDVDAVVHLAAYMDSHPDYSTYFSVNALGTALLYEVIREHSLPIKKIILASSQSVYGEGKYKCALDSIQYPLQRTKQQLELHQWDVICPKCGKPMEVMPQQEDDALYPLSAYGESKVALERIAMNIGKQIGVPSVALRYSIVHGPYQSFRHYYSGALRSFVAMALSGRDIEYHEDAQQLRDFVHAKDVADAHLCLLEDSRTDWQIYNVASGRTTSVFDLAKTVSDIVGVPFKTSKTVRFREATPRNSIMDISKLKNLDWQPSHTLEDNVRDYVDWVRKYPEAHKYFSRASA